MLRVTARRIAPALTVSIALLAGTLGALPTPTVPVARAADTDLALQSSTEVTEGVLLNAYTYAGASGTSNVKVLRIDPDEAPLTVKSTLGLSVAAAEKTSDMLASTTTVPSRDPYGGVNAGLFDNALADNYSLPDGEPMGISVRNGILQREACLSPTDQTWAAVLEYGRPYITQLSTHLTVTAGSENRELDGVNRYPGRIYRCKTGPDDIASGVKSTYTDASEIVAFTPQYGIPTPVPGTFPDLTADDDPGVEVVLDAKGVVTSFRQGRGGTTVPLGGRVLQGIGEGADWLTAHAKPGATLRLDTEITDNRFGDVLPLDSTLDVINTSHVLLQDGTDVYTLGDTAINPRTALGVDGFGRTLLVTVDGRTESGSGATLEELARLMQELGAIDAVNLDGGGSTTMVVGQTVRNQPSDPTGERPAGDAVYAGHGGYGLYE